MICTIKYSERICIIKHGSMRDCCSSSSKLLKEWPAAPLSHMGGRRPESVIQMSENTDYRYAVCSICRNGTVQMAGGSRRDCFNYLVSLPKEDRRGLAVTERTASPGTETLMRLMSVSEFLSICTYRGILDSSMETASRDRMFRLRDTVGAIIN